MDFEEVMTYENDYCFEVRDKYLELIVNNYNGVKSELPEVEIAEIIVISLGEDCLHDSGYPLMQVYGVGIDKHLYDLGLHDIIIIETKNDKPRIDSLGENIIRLLFNELKRVSSNLSDTLVVMDDIIY